MATVSRVSHIAFLESSSDIGLANDRRHVVGGVTCCPLTTNPSPAAGRGGKGLSGGEMARFGDVVVFAGKALVEFVFGFFYDTRPGDD
jgi:hypothetical protein